MVQLRAAYSEDKGCRNTMEDVAVLELDGRSSKELQTRQAVAAPCCYDACMQRASRHHPDRSLPTASNFDLLQSLKPCTR